MSSLYNELALPIDNSDEHASDTADSQPGATRSKVNQQDTNSSLNSVELGTLSQVLAISKDRMAAIDRHGNYVYINSSMREFCDFSDSAFPDQPSVEQQRFAEIKRLILDNLEPCMNGESRTNTAHIRDTDGTEGILTVQLVPYRSLGGDIPACIVTAEYSCAQPESQKSGSHDYNADLISRRFLRALDFFSGAIALYDQDDRKLVFNKTYKDIHSFLGDELKIGMTFSECVRLQIDQGISKDAVGREEEFIAKRTERFRNPTGPFVVRKPGNKWYRVTEQRLNDGGCLQTMEDISEMKMAEIALRESEQRFKDFAETAADFFWEMDEHLKFSYLSARYEELTGDKPEALLGLDLRETVSVKYDQSVCTRLDTAFKKKLSFEDIVVHYGEAEDNYRYFSFGGRPLFDENDEFIGYRGTSRDITEARKLTDQLHYLARHDSLTKLMNRREFNDQVSRVQKDAKIRNSPATLGFIDLDQFKIVNDTEGHPAGDQLLKELSTFLASKLRSNDILARLGGDEFGLLMEGCGIDDGKIIVEKLMSRLRDFNFVYNGRVFGITASVGLVEINNNDASIEDLIRQVDIACYAAKDLGRNQVHVYDPRDFDVEKRSQEILHASGIQQAITQDRFLLYAQPISSTGCTSDNFDHYEILLRMLDEQDNELTPASFIPVAERYRLMSDIDRWVIHNTLKSLHKAPPDFDHTQFTINLSGGSFTDSTLVKDIQTEFASFGIAPERIIFEITETAVVASVERACQFIDQLTEFGCRFAIDDFGSGMSSFSYLKRFEAQFLKIDGSLIREIATESDDRNMVAAINQMAHVLGMQTIAEFVENQEIVDVLDEIGVDMLQGYGIGRPTPLPSVLTDNQVTK